MFNYAVWHELTETGVTQGLFAVLSSSLQRLMLGSYISTLQSCHSLVQNSKC